MSTIIFCSILAIPFSVIVICMIVALGKRPGLRRRTKTDRSFQNDRRCEKTISCPLEDRCKKDGRCKVKILRRS